MYCIICIIPQERNKSCVLVVYLEGGVKGLFENSSYICPSKLTKLMIKRYDFLVIGSGIAGMSFALKVAHKGTVALICKSGLEEANTFFAQGGVASVTNIPVDNFDKHIEDTMIAGDFLSARDAVEKVVLNAPRQIDELISWGVNFDKDDNGNFDLHREGGHSEFRILHHKDNTGAEIQASLIAGVKRHPNITVYENHFAIEILTQHHLGITVTRQTPDIECFGAYIMDKKTGKIDTFLSKTTLMATGGIGAVYQTTTNPLVATGDGIAMVYRAKGTVKDMEFVQFHPTALFHPGDRPSFLITEAMRGYGGILRTMDGKEFMHKYDERLSLAPRDIVARAIDNEMKNRGEDHVYLDVTHKDADETRRHFPNIYEKCYSLGIDITGDYIPVAPAAHYLCGGIKVDLDARSSIHRLYAVGECSCTGLHGGNRLASNSLIEAVVYADAAARDSLKIIDSLGFQEQIPEWNDEGVKSPEEMVLITQSVKEVGQIMSTYVGIVRSNLRLKRAWERLDILYEETESLFKRSVASRDICELRNMINVGYLIMRQAIERKESRGLHYTLDYPNKLRIEN
jgi:L-aspartate oxidase